MTEEFYASIKLVSGEELFAITSAEEHTLILQDPVCIQTVHGPRGSYIRVEPWMHVPDDQFFFIDKDKVITMTEVADDNDMIDYYTEYLLDAAEERVTGIRSVGGKKVREILRLYALAEDHFVLCSRAEANCRSESALSPNGSSAAAEADVSFR